MKDNKEYLKIALTFKEIRWMLILLGLLILCSFISTVISLDYNRWVFHRPLVKQVNKNYYELKEEIEKIKIINNITNSDYSIYCFDGFGFKEMDSHDNTYIALRFNEIQYFDNISFIVKYGCVY